MSNTTEKRKNYTKAISLIGIMTALIAVSAQITVPLPSGVPVTLQTFTVALCGYLLGSKRSVLSVLVYILLGLVGVPIFSAFTAGTAALFGKTGGFIIGFLFVALFCGLPNKKRIFHILCGCGGLVICHAAGTLWFAFLTKMNFFAALALVSLPFIVKDIICIVIAMFVSERLKKIIVK